MSHHSHLAGDPLSIFGIPITLHKTTELDKFGSPVLDITGTTVMKCGFRIGGGIDQDHTRNPHGYPDKGIYVTHVEERGAADLAGLQVHDKILQVNGYDFTMVTHDKACKLIRKDSVLQIIAFRGRNVQRDLYSPKLKQQGLYNHTYAPNNQHTNFQAVHNGYATPLRY